MSNEQIARRGRAMVRVLLSVVLILSCSVALRAQSTYGALTGTVVDQTGAAVVGASVTLTNVGTSEKQVQATGDTGLYSFVNLYPGQYRLTVDKAGFKKVDRQNVVVQVQQTTRIDIPLAVGQTTDTVTVTSEVPLLQADTSSLGQVVEERNADAHGYPHRARVEGPHCLEAPLAVGRSRWRRQLPAGHTGREPRPVADQYPFPEDW